MIRYRILLALVCGFLGGGTISRVAAQETGSPWELIPLERLGVVLEESPELKEKIGTGQVISLGFTRDTTGLHLVAVVLAAGQPVKYSVAADEGLYARIRGPAPPAEPAPEAPRAGPAPEVTPPRPNQDGRMYFMFLTTVRATYVLPVNLNVVVEDIRWNINAGITLLTLGGTLYGSYLATQDRELGWGKVAMMNYGGELGIAVPALVSTFLEGIIDDPHSNKESFPALKFNAITTLFGFPAGLYAGMRYNPFGHTQFGNVELWRYFGRLAWLYGFSLPCFLPEKIFMDHPENYLTVASGLTMALTPTGLYLGHKIIKNQGDFSSGRSFFIVTTGLMGTATGIIVPVLLDLPHADIPELTIMRIFVLSGLAGNVAGTWFGFDYKKGTPYQYQQGLFMAFSAVGGGAIGLAVPLILEANGEKPYLLSALLGAWAGLILGETLSHTIWEKTTRDQRREAGFSFPVFTQLPAALALAAGAGERHKLQLPPVTLLEWRF